MRCVARSEFARVSKPASGSIHIDGNPADTLRAFHWGSAGGITGQNFVVDGGKFMQ